MKRILGPEILEKIFPRRIFGTNKFVKIENGGF
jgi:hypothetical protein